MNYKCCPYSFFHWHKAILVCMNDFVILSICLCLLKEHLETQVFTGQFFAKVTGYCLCGRWTVRLTHDSHACSCGANK